MKLYKATTTFFSKNEFESARREKLVREYLYEKEEASAHKKRADALKAEIENLFEDGRDTLSAGRYVVIKKVTIKRNLDTATLRKELPELWAEYGKDVPSVSLAIG